jgi:1,4-dihydroxy-2-naphthoate octaprenyltransferase
MIQLGLLSPREVLAGGLVLFTLGGAIGLYLTITRGILVLILGLIGVFSGFFYTAPPVKLASRGIGESVIGLGFGILLTLGAFYVQLQFLAWEPVLAAIPVALLITAVLYINEFQDSAADEAAGKRTLVVRLGRKRAAIGYAVILTTTHIFIILAIAAHAVSPYTIVSLSSLPLSVLSIRYALAAYDRPFELIPANALTVLNHLLTGLALTIGYLLHGLAIPYPYVIVAGSLLVAIAIILCHKMASRAKLAAKLTKKPTTSS